MNGVGPAHLEELFGPISAATSISAVVVAFERAKTDLASLGIIPPERVAKAVSVILSIYMQELPQAQRVRIWGLLMDAGIAQAADKDKFVRGEM